MACVVDKKKILLQVVIFTSKTNVMTADNLREMYKLHQKVSIRDVLSGGLGKYLDLMPEHQLHQKVYIKGQQENIKIIAQENSRIGDARKKEEFNQIR